MFMFKLVPKDERALIKSILKRFLLLILFAVIILNIAHKPKPKCEPTPDKKSCQTKEK